MTVKIIDNSIVMTRGDTLRVKVNIFDCDGNDYIPDENDTIRFALKSSYNDPIPLIKKQIPNNTLLLELKPEDTKILEQPATYVYDIQITMSDGTVDTFISKAKLKITEEVD